MGPNNDILNETYGSYDPWSPIKQDIAQMYAQSNLINLEIHEFTHDNKCDLNYPTYDTMCYAVQLLQEHFRDIISDCPRFMEDKSMIKYVALIIKSLQHVNINFIEKWTEWLSLDYITPRVRLFRMLGIFVQYLTTPTMFESVVLTEPKRIHHHFAAGLKINFKEEK